MMDDDDGGRGGGGTDGDIKGKQEVGGVVVRYDDVSVVVVAVGEWFLVLK